MELVLVRVKPDGQTANLPISKTETVFGRHTECTVRIPSSQISRRHCQITLDDGEAVLTDLGSSNGTFVAGKRIDSSVPLSAGDLVSFGGFVFVVQMDGSPGETDIDASIAYGDGLPAATSHAAAAAPEDRTVDSSGMERLTSLGSDSADESSVIDFDFDFEDDEDEQPPL